MIRLSTVAVLAALAIGLLMVVFGRNVLPTKYYIDSDRMAAMAEISDPGRASRSDMSTVAFYRAVGIRGIAMTPVAGVFNLSVAFGLLLLILRRRETRPWHAVVMFPWMALLAIYLSMYSKEFLTVVSVGLLCAGIGSRVGAVAGVAALAAYGGLVRSYWLLVIAYGIAFAITLNFKIRPVYKCAVALSGILFSLWIFRSVTGFYLTDARTLLVAFRAGDPDSQTLVQNILPNSTSMHDAANLLIGWARFVLPASLIGFGGAQHIVFCLLQIATVAVVAWSLMRDDRGRAVPGTNARWEYVMLVSLGAAVTLVLSAFDGDFGSYARHQIALVPWLALVLARRSPTPQP